MGLELMIMGSIKYGNPSNNYAYGTRNKSYGNYENTIKHYNWLVNNKHDNVIECNYKTL